MKRLSVHAPLTRRFACLLFSLYGLALAQQAVDKKGWPAHEHPSGIPNSTLDNNGDYRAVFQIYRAAACTRPGGFVNDQFARAINFVQSSPIGGREAPRREWNHSAEWKSGECGWSAIILDRSIQANWPRVLIQHSLDVSGAPAYSDIQVIVPCAICSREVKILDPEIGGAWLPSVPREVDCGSRTLGDPRGVRQVADNVASGSKTSICSQEEGSSLYGNQCRFNGPTRTGQLNAYHRGYGALYLRNGFRESRFSGGSLLDNWMHRGASGKHDANEDNSDSHTMGGTGVRPSLLFLGPR